MQKHSLQFVPRVLSTVWLSMACMIGASAARATDPSDGKLVLTAEESAGGNLLKLSQGVAAVTLDASCKDAGPAGPVIQWKTPLAAGWWHGTLFLSPREGDEKSWVNTHVGIVLDTPQAPMVNMMTNGVFNLRSFDAQQFEFWVYSSAPASGVRIQSVYDSLYRYKRTWPIVRLTLEPTEPKALTSDNPVTLDLPVQPGGAVSLPTSLPPGNWAIHAAMSKEGKLICQEQDGRAIEAPFLFDRWKRPGALHVYLESPLKTMQFQTAGPFKSVVLEHLIHRPPAPPIPTDGQLITTVDPAKRESADLVMIGTNLTGEAPTLPLVPKGKKFVVMTTWDDGSADDLRCAQILHKHGYHPSFFVNGNTAALKFLDKLEALEAEVGSHCYHHPSLHELPPAEAADECSAMRKLLECELKHPVISFAYPNGYSPSFDAKGDYVLRAVRDAGYWSGRTTLTDTTTVESTGDLLTMKSDGFFGSVKELDVAWQQARAKEGGIFYFWGHSWQIGKTDEQWQKFDDFVGRFAGRPDAWYASQGEFSLWVWARKQVRFQVTQNTPMQCTITVTRPWLHPYLSAKCPLTLSVPRGVESVVWKGQRIPVAGGVVELSWP